MAHGYEVTYTGENPAYAGTWTLQGTEGAYALLYKYIGFGQAEFARVPLADIVAQ